MLVRKDLVDFIPLFDLNKVVIGLIKHRSKNGNGNGKKNREEETKTYDRNRENEKSDNERLLLLSDEALLGPKKKKKPN